MHWLDMFHFKKHFVIGKLGQDPNSRCIVTQSLFTLTRHISNSLCSPHSFSRTPNLLSFPLPPLFQYRLSYYSSIPQSYLFLKISLSIYLFSHVTKPCLSTQIHILQLSLPPTLFFPTLKESPFISRVLRSLTFSFQTLQISASYRALGSYSKTLQKVLC